MSADIYKKVRANPRFAALEAKRNRFAYTLTALVMVAYYALIMVIAFAPDLLRTPMVAGGVLTVGVPVGAVIVIGSWLLTGWFVARSNGEFDRDCAAIVREASK